MCRTAGKNLLGRQVAGYTAAAAAGEARGGPQQGRPQQRRKKIVSEPLVICHLYTLVRLGKKGEQLAVNHYYAVRQIDAATFLIFLFEMQDNSCVRKEENKKYGAKVPRERRRHSADIGPGSRAARRAADNPLKVLAAVMENQVRIFFSSFFSLPPHKGTGEHFITPASGMRRCHAPSQWPTDCPRHCYCFSFHIDKREIEQERKSFVMMAAAVPF